MRPPEEKCRWGTQRADHFFTEGSAELDLGLEGPMRNKNVAIGRFPDCANNFSSAYFVSLCQKKQTYTWLQGKA